MPSRILLIAFILSILLPVAAAAQDQSNQQSEQPSNPSQPTAAPETPPTRIRVGGNVMVANITKMVKPVYPDIAKRASICGTVVLHAIVGKDGSVQELKYISGPPLLMKAALDAVRKWRYAPTLLQGQPVEVDTTISVVFELKGCKPIQPSAQPQAQEAPEQRPLGTLDSRPFWATSIGPLSGSDGGDAQSAFLKQLFLPRGTPPFWSGECQQNEINA